MFRIAVIVLCFVVMLAIGSPCVQGAEIRVPTDQPTIQAGITAAADGDTVLVSDGVHSGPGNRDLDFLGKAITVTSANGPQSCTIDIGGSEGEPHRGFYFQHGEGPDSVVHGFTIRGGWMLDDGAAISGYQAGPTISGNLITGNTTGYHDGTVIYFVEGSPVITGNTITSNGKSTIYCKTSDSVITSNLITDNEGSDSDGSIHCWHGSVQISGNTISRNAGIGIELWGVATGTVTDNLVRRNGGNGIKCQSCSPLIAGNVIELNYGGYPGGGGISCVGADPEIRNNLIAGNTANRGGGIGCWGSRPTIDGCTIADNTAVEWARYGGGLYLTDYSQAVVTNTILRNPGTEVAFYDWYYCSGGGEITISYCSIQGWLDGVYDTYGTVYWGNGNIYGDPLFVTGLDGDFYLSQTAAGEAEQSNCVDAGDPVSALPGGSTRSDSLPDGGRRDMGYHFPEVADGVPDTVITGGPEGYVDSPVLTFTFTGSDVVDAPGDLLFSYRLDDGEWSEFNSATSVTLTQFTTMDHTFSVRSRDTDGNVDPSPAQRQFTAVPWTTDPVWQGLVTTPGPAPANPPLVRTAEAQWSAYGVFKYGANVAAGQLVGTSAAEIVTGPGPGAVFGPQVRGWTAGGAPLARVNFLAYGTNKYGVNVACGDLDGDGYDEILTGAGPGSVFGPHVRGWNVDNGTAAAMPDISFFAYGTPRWGVNVACGDLDGDGFDEIVTGAGPGAVYGPHVRGWNYDGAGILPIPGVSFFAYGTLQFGVNVTCGDIDGDGMAEIVTGAGPGAVFGAHVRGWNVDGGQASAMPGVSYLAYDTRYGVEVAASDLDGDGRDEILTAPGPDSSAGPHVRGWSVEAGSVAPVEEVDFQAYDPWMTHGCRVAGVPSGRQRK